MLHAYVPWLMHMCHDSSVCAMTHACVPWLIQMCHDSFICTMTHSYLPWRATVNNKAVTKTYSQQFLRESPSCLRQEHLEIFWFWWFLRIKNFAVQKISLTDFQKIVLVQIGCLSYSALSGLYRLLNPSSKWTENMHVRTHIYIHVCICMYVRMYMYIYVYINRYIFICICMYM